MYGGADEPSLDPHQTAVIMRDFDVYTDFNMRSHKKHTHPRMHARTHAQDLLRKQP